MHPMRTISGLVVVMALAVALLGCGGGGDTGGGGTTRNLPEPSVDTSANYATFAPTEAEPVNFVYADFQSVNDPSTVISGVPFYETTSGVWDLSFSDTNHAAFTTTATGYYYMTVYVLLANSGQTVQVGARYKVNLNIVVNTDSGDIGGPPPPPWGD
jgi:hypothetical protein